MKKLILAAFALTAAASVYAQGTIFFANRVAGADINQNTHVYAPLGPGDTNVVIGLGANDTPVGTTVFGARALIGASGLTGPYSAGGTYGQLLLGAGAGLPEGSLAPVGQITTFRTGTGAGFMAQITDTLASPFTADYSGPMTAEIVAWDNSSGNYPTWTQASTAWRDGLIAAGRSAPFGLTALGGLNPPPYLTQMGANLTSFNLYFLSTVPEPSTFALAGLGAAALLIFRRRK